jgi:uncharacterized protein YdcH (DUF465 family)
LEHGILSNKDKLDEDFSNFNVDIERATEKELSKLREEILALKDKAKKISEELEPSLSNEDKKGK